MIGVGTIEVDDRVAVYTHTRGPWIHCESCIWVLKGCQSYCWVSSFWVSSLLYNWTYSIGLSMEWKVTFDGMESVCCVLFLWSNIRVIHLVGLVVDSRGFRWDGKCVLCFVFVVEHTCHTLSRPCS